jgi:glycosyltransferase involved in cell wall biosynthesis
MQISVIICTHGRAASLADLLASLDVQSYSDAEILIVDGNAEPSPAREIADAFLRNRKGNIGCDLVPSKKGLTRQRNIGLGRATGDILCFLDDDVTLPKDFLQRVTDIFARQDFQDVGGITGYDDVNYSAPLTWRWRLRRTLGVIPDLPPGGVDRLGRGIPLSFLQPFTGFKEVGLLPGFCMIYRRSAVGTLRFDELIPTYAGEDRDFSMQIGWRSRLLVCGDLHLSHHASLQGRDSELARNFQSAFGMGRRFAKFAHGGRDWVKLGGTFLGDSVIDAMFLLVSPGRMNGATFITRIKGFFAGLSSETKARRQPELSSNPGSSEP